MQVCCQSHADPLSTEHSTPRGLFLPMSRIRTIKPEFPLSETMGRVSRDARLLFIQLWTIVDDAGRTRAASRVLASLLYPFDDDAKDLIDDWLAELESVDAVRRYEVDGTTYLEVVKWLTHQRIDRPSPSRLPANDGNSTKPRESSRILDAGSGPRTLDLGPKDISSASPPSDAPEKTTPSLSTSLPKDSAFERFWNAYPKTRKVGKGKCMSLWKTKNLDKIADHIIVHIEAMKNTEQWQSGWDPSPVTYLQQGRWQDDMPDGPKRGGLAI